MNKSLEPKTTLGDRFFTAIIYATNWHGDQVRKSTNIPYICHPLGAASLVIEAGGDEDQAIGALLHDIAEDCGGEARLVEIKELFGDRVESIVRGCSDSLVEKQGSKAPWRERKEQHLAHLASASDDTLIVSAADKLHNARAIATDFQAIGKQIWDRFNADQQMIIWYYQQMLNLFINRAVSTSLTNPLEAAISMFSADVLHE